MVLVTALGFGLERWLQWPAAVPLALLVGLLLARLVPPPAPRDGG